MENIMQTQHLSEDIGIGDTFNVIIPGKPRRWWKVTEIKYYPNLYQNLRAAGWDGFVYFASSSPVGRQKKDSNAEVLCPRDEDGFCLIALRDSKRCPSKRDRCEVSDKEKLEAGGRYDDGN
jgi:hypothetical protein